MSHITYIFIVTFLISIYLFLEYKTEVKNQMTTTQTLIGMVTAIMIVFLPILYVFDNVKYVLFRNKSNNNKQNNMHRNT